MELEQQRGISITSTVLQFPYRDCVVNLLDTPGHRDFSEDTYRVLAAADAAVMVLDAAKGIEPQTLKLFEVVPGPAACRCSPSSTSGTGPGRDALELLDEIEQQIGLRPRRSPGRWASPATSAAWSTAARGDFVRFTRTARGATEAPEEIVDAERAAAEEGASWTHGAPTSSSCSRHDGRWTTTTSCSWPASRRRPSSARRSPTSACGCCSTR